GQVADHLAQGGVLATDLLEVGHAELGERADVGGLGHGRLLGVPGTGELGGRATDGGSAFMVFSRCRMIVEISSTDLVEESTTGRSWRRNISAVRRSSKVHCSREA